MTNRIPLVFVVLIAVSAVISLNLHSQPGTTPPEAQEANA